MKNKEKILLTFFANTQLQIELIDKLKGTKMYNLRLKQLLNQVQKENERNIYLLYTHLNEDCEYITHRMINAVDVILTAVEDGKIEDLILVLDAFSKGEIKNI